MASVKHHDVNAYTPRRLLHTSWIQNLRKFFWVARGPIGVLHNVKRHRETPGILKTAHRHEVKRVEQGTSSSAG